LTELQCKQNATFVCRNVECRIFGRLDHKAADIKYCKSKKMTASASLRC